MQLPGWDSLESAIRYNFWFHIAALVFIALLAWAEIMAFVYGERRETLAHIADGVATTQRKADADAAETRRKADVEALQKQVAAAERATAEADKKASQAQAQQADRRLTEDQKRAILVAISPYPGQKVDLVATLGDSESFQYAEEFLSLFRAAKWEISGGGIAQAAYTGGVPVGIQVTISAAHGAAGTAPIGAGKLIIALIHLGLIKEGFSNPSVVADDALIRVGRKILLP